MNQNVQRYRLLRGVLTEQAVHEMFFADRPICSIDVATFAKGAELEERAGIARQIINRVRFLAKHSRSKYMPHTGMKQLIKGGARVLAGLPLEVPAYKPERNT